MPIGNKPKIHNNDVNAVNVYDSDDSEDFNIESENDSSVDLEKDETEPSSSEEEVLGIYSESEVEEENNLESVDDEFEEDFDVKKSVADDQDDDLVSSKAWGKRKKHFYQSTTIAKRNSFRNEAEEEAAKMEENEALAIQKRHAAEIDNVDLISDLFPDIIENDEQQLPAKEKELIEIDLERLSKSEKIKLLKNDCPELLVYITDFTKYTTRLKEKLHPLLSLKSSKVKFKNSDFWYFIQSMQEIIMTYCTNIVFYILHKLRPNIRKFHPVMDRLSNYKNLLEKLDSIYINTFEQLVDSILSGDIPADQIPKSKLISNVSHSVIHETFELNENAPMNLSEKQVEKTIDDGDISETEDDIDLQLYGKMSDDENIKRGINYEIAKNKGLTPRRKKECRNPRVKLRNKYRKAKIRRKGQIREPRKEIKRYSGEISGINPNVSRSIQLKF